jgi:hypothetical protein
VTYLDPLGTVLRSVRLNLGGLATYVGQLPGGLHLVLQGKGALSERSGSDGGIVTERVQLLLFDAEGDLVAEPASFPQAEMWTWIGPSGPSIRPSPFGRRGHWTLWENRFVYGFNDRYELLVFSGRLDLTTLLRRPIAPVPVSRAQRKEYLRRLRESPMLSRAGIKAGNIKFPRTHGVFSSILSDREGRLWVKEMGSPEPGEGPPDSRWNVFDRVGRWTANVMVPRDLRVTDIGEEYLLGLRRNELGIEGIAEFSLDHCES